MRVAVAGGTGYVGAVLVRELLARGHSVLVCDQPWLGDSGQVQLGIEADIRAEYGQPKSCCGL